MADTSEAGEGENSQGDDDEGGDEEEAEGGDDEEDQAYERMNDGFNITNEEDGEREEKFDALGAELEEEESNDKKAVEKLAKKREEQLKELEVEKEAKKKDKKARQRVDGDTIMFAMGGIAALNAINQQALKTKLKVYKYMPGFVKLDGNRLTKMRGNTPIASGHLYTTLSRYLNKPTLDYK
ncbi:hypothetical protein CYMTET_30286 [Cymbomonas tetramitiformis]|uniref:Uncharacterized protein n=1 Tax=Cymbomonas tetramitiformis TaxID=36881 RepID=A0AAE0KU30_9CHLO|nr:hypothetical protein CYMTET_30286 [Cymbomonas tetramitiformis]